MEQLASQDSFYHVVGEALATTLEQFGEKPENYIATISTIEQSFNPPSVNSHPLTMLTLSNKLVNFHTSQRKSSSLYIGGRELHGPLNVDEFGPLKVQEGWWRSWAHKIVGINMVEELGP